MKLPRWLVTVGKWALMIGCALGLVAVARKPLAAAVASVVDWISPERRRGWRRVPGDPNHVDVIQPEGGPVRVKLPPGVQVDDVRGIGASREGWHVEVLHTARDRRAPVGG